MHNYNRKFRIDNTDHIIDVNKGNIPFEYDQVNIICPVYMPGTHEEDAEKYMIYNVSKEEYDTCRITNPNPHPRIIAKCDKPYKLMYFTITFRPFTPQPGGLEFQPGHDYYFISNAQRPSSTTVVTSVGTSPSVSAAFSTAIPPTSTRPTSLKELDMPNYNVKSTTKKTNEYDNKHPNEVLKNEELTYNRAQTQVAGPVMWHLLTGSCATVLLAVRLVGW